MSSRNARSLGCLDLADDGRDRYHYGEGWTGHAPVKRIDHRRIQLLLRHTEALTVTSLPSPRRGYRADHRVWDRVAPHIPRLTLLSGDARPLQTAGGAGVPPIHAQSAHRFNCGSKVV